MLSTQKLVSATILILCMALLLLLTACNNGGDTPTEDNSTLGTSSAPTETPNNTPGTNNITPDIPEAPASDFEYREGSAHDRIIITKYIGKSTSVKIPEIIDELPVMSIDDSAFEGCNFLTSVVIPNSVVFIGEFVFRNCTALTDVTMPYNGGGLIAEIVAGDGDTYKSTDKGIFDGCDSLASITAIVSDGVTSIAWRAFADCIHLVNVIIPEGVEFIGEEAFMNCTSLLSLTLPQSMNTIHGNAFMGNSTTRLNIIYTGKDFGDDYLCLRQLNTPVEINVVVADGITEIGQSIGDYSHIVSINIPDSVTSINLWAFHDLNLLESVIIGNGITDLQPKVENTGNGENISYGEAGLFQNLRSLKRVTIGNSVKTIGDSTFEDCISLTDIIIPESVTTMGNSAFKNCTSLKSIRMPNGMTEIGFGAFSGNTSLESIAIPEGITIINSSMFWGCESLASVMIPESVTVIDTSAFAGCKTLKNLTLPDSLTTIGNGAFGQCESLVSLTIPNSVTKVGEYTFDGIPNFSVVYKGKTYNSTYSEASGWKMSDEFYNAINNG